MYVKRLILVVVGLFALFVFIRAYASSKDSAGVSARPEAQSSYAGPSADQNQHP